jgi:rhombotail lipoprotein
MLFNASGQSSGAGSSTPVDMGKKLRAEQERGFDAATADLIQNLDVALAVFQEQAKTGTVRGQGTPALAIVDEQGRVVSGGAEGVSAGALGPLEALAGAALAALGAMGWRRRKVAGR